MARLVAYRGSNAKREPGQWRGQVWMSDDFDETPAELIASFEGGSGA